MPFYERTVILTSDISSQNKSERPLRADHKRVSLLGSFAGQSFIRQWFVTITGKWSRHWQNRICCRLCCGLQGSMTVEAALALPLYIFFLCNVLYIMEAVQFQSRMSAALHESGMRMCEYAYYVHNEAGIMGLVDGETQEGADGNSGQAGERISLPEGLGGMVLSTILSESYARSSCLDYLGEEYLAKGPVKGGREGISFVGSSITDQEGCIDLQAQYQIRSFVPVLAPSAYTLGSRFYAYPFVGYDVSSGSEAEQAEEEMVYITATSTQVYHRSRSCTYLVPNKQTVRAEDVDHLRNEQGGKYYPCESCHPAKAGMLIITSDGTRFHRDENCSAISRNVMEIPLSQAQQTRHACARCGGG